VSYSKLPGQVLTEQQEREPSRPKPCTAPIEPQPKTVSHNIQC